MPILPEAYLKRASVLLNGEHISTENEQESLSLYMEKNRRRKDLR